MKPASAKAKGRRLQNRVVADIVEAFPHLTEDDVRGAVMGESGEDVPMSPAARACIPLSLECANQEKLNIWSKLNQAEGHRNDHPGAVVFTRNRTPVYIALEWGVALQLLKRLWLAEER